MSRVTASGAAMLLRPAPVCEGHSLRAKAVNPDRNRERQTSSLRAQRQLRPAHSVSSVVVGDGSHEHVAAPAEEAWRAETLKLSLNNRERQSVASTPARSTPAGARNGAVKRGPGPHARLTMRKVLQELHLNAVDGWSGHMVADKFAERWTKARAFSSWQSACFQKRQLRPAHSVSCVLIGGGSRGRVAAPAEGAYADPGGGAGPKRCQCGSATCCKLFNSLFDALLAEARLRQAASRKPRRLRPAKQQSRWHCNPVVVLRHAEYPTILTAHTNVGRSASW